jgi:hypothetical protein
MEPGEIPRGQVGAATHPRPAWVPLAKRACINEIDQILLSVLKAGGKEVHAAIERILKGWPGVTRDELWDRLRHLRNRNQVRRGQSEWNEEHLAILRAYYAQGRAGAREAVKKLRVLRPDLSARSIRRQAAELGISTGSGRAKPWSREEQGALLWDAGEKPVEKIARKLGRSVQAVQQMLSSRGVSSRVRVPKSYTLRRVARLLGVSDRIVRVWFQKGFFGESANQGRNRERSSRGPRVSAAAVFAFCQKHPGKINTRKCDPDLLQLMEDNGVQLNAWQGVRQHLTKQRQRPSCRRVVRGNAYFRHVKRCGSGRAPANGIESPRATTG